MSESLSVIYHNVLADRGHEAEQIAYYRAMQKEYEPEITFLTEFRAALKYTLSIKDHTVDYRSAIDDRRHGQEGIAVVSRLKPDEMHITREQSWDGEPIKNRLRHDARELVRVELPRVSGGLALYAGHIFHPHHLHYPVFGVSRPKQWQHLRKTLASEPLPSAYLADTNTFFAASVRRALHKDAGDAILLPHTGHGPQRTWRPIGPMTRKLCALTGSNMPDILYLDRAAASRDLAPHVTLETLPPCIDGAYNPSDHRPIMLRITI